jgi:hypothetical protein
MRTLPFLETSGTNHLAIWRYIRTEEEHRVAKA